MVEIAELSEHTVPRGFWDLLIVNSKLALSLFQENTAGFQEKDLFMQKS